MVQNGPKCAQRHLRGTLEVPSAPECSRTAPRAGNQRNSASQRASWELPGRPRGHLGMLRGRLGEYFGSLFEVRGGIGNVNDGYMEFIELPKFLHGF